MNTQRRKILQLSAIAASSLLLAGCGNDSDENCEAESSFDLIEEIEFDSNEITVRFYEPIDFETLSRASVVLRDRDGILTEFYSVLQDQDDILDRTLKIELNDGYKLKDSWVYYISFSSELKYIDGMSIFSENQEIEIHTDAKHPFSVDEDSDEYISTVSNSNGISLRHKFVFLSDTHMNEERSSLDKNNNYGWFHSNQSARLVDFLEQVQVSSDIAELIFLGDIFDDWVIPMEFEPRDNSNGVYDTRDYYISVANNSINKPVVELLNTIANENKIVVTYVPGNHDMTLDYATFQEIFPNVIYHNKSSDSNTTYDGHGVYSPAGDTNIVSEHGHAYDWMNAPIPDKNPLMLPPGHFVSRMYASHAKKTTVPKVMPRNIIIYDEFYLAWTLTRDYLNISKKALFIDALAQTQHTAGNIPDFFRPITDSGAWPDRQKALGILHPTDAISGMIYTFPEEFDRKISSFIENQYFNKKDKEIKKIAICGHTHVPKMKVFKHTKWYWSKKHKASVKPYAIFADSGTWMDADKSGTYVIVDSGKITKSEIYTVSLHRHTYDSQTQDIDSYTVNV